MILISFVKCLGMFSWDILKYIRGQFLGEALAWPWNGPSLLLKSRFTIQTEYFPDKEFHLFPHHYSAWINYKPFISEVGWHPSTVLCVMPPTFGCSYPHEPHHTSCSFKQGTSLQSKWLNFLLHTIICGHQFRFCIVLGLKQLALFAQRKYGIFPPSHLVTWQWPRVI